MRLIEALSPGQVMAFALVTLLMLGVLVWRLTLFFFRREPPGLLRRSFFDATGTPNGVLLTVCNAVIMMNALSINGIIRGGWPPAYVWATWGTIVLIGIGADAKVTLKQIENGKSRPGFGGMGGAPFGDDCGPGTDFPGPFNATQPPSSNVNPESATSEPEN